MTPPSELDGLFTLPDERDDPDATSSPENPGRRAGRRPAAACYTPARSVPWDERRSSDTIGGAGGTANRTTPATQDHRVRQPVQGARGTVVLAGAQGHRRRHHPLPVRPRRGHGPGRMGARRVNRVVRVYQNPAVGFLELGLVA